MIVPCPICISYAMCVNQSVVDCEILDDTFKESYISYDLLREIRLTLKKDKIIIDSGHFTAYNYNKIYAYAHDQKESKW